MKSKIIFTVLFIFVAIIAFSINVQATNEFLIGADNECDYATIEEAIAVVADGDAIKLTENIILSDTIEVEVGSNYSIDLNGYKISFEVPDNENYKYNMFDLGGTAIKILGGSLTIKDSSQAGNGEIYVTAEALANMNYHIITGILVESGNLDISNIKITAQSDASKRIVSYGFEARGGSTLISNVTAHDLFINDSASVHIKSGNFTSADGTAISIFGATLVTIDAGTFTGTSSAASVFPNENIKLVINGGTFTGKGYYYEEEDETYGGEAIAFGENDANEKYSDVKIYGGTFIGETACALTSTPKMKMLYGGTYISKIDSGISVSQGEKWKIVFGDYIDEGNTLDETITPLKLVADGYTLNNLTFKQAETVNQMMSTSDYYKCYDSKTVATVKVIKNTEPQELNTKSTESDVIAKAKFTGTPELTVEKINKDNANYKAFLDGVAEKESELIGSYEISITKGSFTGSLELSFKVDSKYNGKTVTIYHKLASGEIEKMQAIVKNGIANATVTELSPFVIAYTEPKPEPEPEPKIEPKEETTTTTESTVENTATVKDELDNTPKTGAINYIFAISAIVIMSIVITKYGILNKEQI